MSIEKTLILVKPDGVRRQLVGEVISRIEDKGYVVVDLKMMQADRALLERHYAEHQGKPFFEPLVEFMMSGPIVAIVAEGNRVIEGFRSLAGATDPTVAAPVQFVAILPAIKVQKLFKILCTDLIHQSPLRAKLKFSSASNLKFQRLTEG